MGNQNKKFDIDSIYNFIKDSNDIDELYNVFQTTKNRDKELFNSYVAKLKVLFSLSEEYEFLSTAALIFGKFKIHSSAHLIVSKLLSGKFDDCGGTFLYSLIPLRKKYFIDELSVLWNREITWEMEQHLKILNIPYE